MVTKVSPNEPTTSFALLDLMNPHIDLSTSRPISQLRLMILALYMTFPLILVVYLVAISLSAAYDSKYGAPAINSGRKLRKGKSPPLDLGRDLEAQPLPVRPHMTFGHIETPTSSLGSWGSHMPNAVASGFGMENLTSPMRLRQLATRVGGGLREEVSPLGLSRYFFDGGVGIKRYESQDEEVSWKDV